GRDDLGVSAAEPDEDPRHAELDGPDAAGRQRNQLQRTRERPAGERLDPRDLARPDPHRAQRDEKDGENREVPDHGGERQPRPAAPNQVDRRPPEHDEALVPALEAPLPAEGLQRAVGGALEELADPACKRVAPEDQY